jgi:hypothetical protein
VVPWDAGEVVLAGLVALRSRRPRNGGGGKIPIKHAELRLRETLEWWRERFPVREFAGVEIRRVARREEEDEVVRCGERMKNYRAAGYLKATRGDSGFGSDGGNGTVAPLDG